MYVQKCQSFIKDIAIPEDVVKKFENDWVESRKLSKTIPTDDIHVWATLLKVMAASHGKNQVELQDLASVLEIETLRRNRVSPLDGDDSINLAENIVKVAVNGA
jgi:Mg-chelatase subunit ChlI